MRVDEQEPDDSVPGQRAALAIRHVAFYGALTHALFIPLFLLLNVRSLAFLNIFSVAVWLYAARLNKRDRTDEAIVWINGEILMHALAATMILGWECGFQAYVILSLVTVSFQRRVGRRILPLVVSLLLTAYLGLYLSTEFVFKAERINTTIAFALFAVNHAVAFLGIGFGTLLFRRASERLEQDMTLLANRDTLTSLPNRRCMTALLHGERKSSILDGKRFVVGLADVDHFKKINDEYGHDCGDFVLKEVGHLLEEALRSGDAVARWGGEEFLILMRSPDIESSLIGVKRAQDRLGSHSFDFQGREVKVSLTFGLVLVEPGGCLETALKTADDRLYQGKRAGRNRVVSEG